MTHHSLNLVLSLPQSLICMQALCPLSVEVDAYVLLGNTLFFGSVHVEKDLGLIRQDNWIVIKDLQCGCSCFCSTGEASSPDDYLWLSGRAGYKPVLEACGGTEVGGSYVGGSLVQPQSFSCFSTPVMANELVILDESGNPFVSFQDPAL